MKKNWLVILLLILTGCGSAFVSEQDAQSGDVLYQDVFSKPSTDWLRTSTSVGAMDYYSDVYRILVNVPDYDLWSVAGASFTNVRIEVDAGRFGGPVENRFGLVCRYRDAQDFYFFVISSDGYYAIGKVSGGMRSLLGQSAMAYNAAIPTGPAPVHLRMDCLGSMLAGYVNGQMVAVEQDVDFSDGDVGLIAGAFDTSGVDVVFDNFVVIKP
jgi:hypothetical protein